MLPMVEHEGAYYASHSICCSCHRRDLSFRALANAWALDWQIDAKYCYGDTKGRARPIAPPARIMTSSIRSSPARKPPGTRTPRSECSMAGRDDVNTYMMGFGAVDGCQ